MEELRKLVLETFFNNNRFNNTLVLSVIKNKHEKYSHITSQLDLLYPNVNLKEQIYLIVNNLAAVPTCATCNTQLTMKTFYMGFNTYCSTKCQYSDTKRMGKIIETKKQRYGDDLENIKEKRKQTNLLKYGCEFPLQNKDILQKTHNVQIENGGVGFANKQNQVKAQQSLLDKFGKKSGNAFVDQKIMDLITKEYLIKMHHENKYSLTYIAYISNASITYLRCKMKEFELDIRYYHTSSLELKIVEWLERNNIEYKQNVRNIIKYELDIFLPQYKLAIECDGFWYHSDNYGYDKNRHLEKQQLCEQQSINLIHLFELDFKEIHKIYFLLEKLLLKAQTIHARKCNVKQIDKATERAFNNQYHFQGHANSSICYGLYYNNELVQIMSFSKPRYAKDCDYELLRLTSSNVTVGGGASKLFKHFVKTHNPKSVISYCNKRLFIGTVYEKIGFTLSHITKPSYWYFDTKRECLYHRSTFQKHKLKTKLKVFDEQLSEWDNMKNNNYNRIWDCGTKVYYWYSPFIPN